MNYQQQLANSAAIRAEIQRFESVHPNIYSIYELLERVEEPVLQNQIREHVIAIEGVSAVGVREDVLANVHLREIPSGSGLGKSL
ncbi:Arf-Gap With Gtpase, Ank Repeat And Ph Domain-Containing Protein 1 [Manis pentadactyla]|nr:Arf-Gap With Gtpase, Ank Repeat And Ph Domain-Containing Protein 1 [Manis pentadactyla]